MAKLHATMENSKGKEVSTVSNTVARTMVETWEVRIVTELDAQGNYTVVVTDRNTGVEIDRLTEQYPAK